MRIFSSKLHRTHSKAPSALLTSSLKQSSYAKYASCFRSSSPRIWNLGTGSKIITTFVLVCFVLTPLFFFTTKTNAAPNYQMNYQGKLTNASNVAVPDGTYNMRFWLLTTSSIATTSAVWTESLTGSNKVQVTNGLFSVMLGSTSPLTGVDFNQTLYLGVEIGGTSTPAWDGEMSPRKILGTVPAAFEADKLDGLTSTQFVRTDATSSISASTADTLLSITQNGAGDLLNLFDGSDEVFSVIDGGNVGIGTTSPSRKFTVGGDAWFGGNLTATGTATFGALSIAGASSFGYASTTGLTTTNFYGTNATTSNLKITGLTGSRALFTDANSLLTTSGVSQYLIDAITDETGTGSLVFSTNPLLAGFRSNASSTIGNGTGAGGLTIYGGATTTGNAYFASNIGIGSSSPSAKLTLEGGDFIHRASSTPTLVGGYDTPQVANDVYVSGRYAYVADGDDGLLIFDVSNSTSTPPLVGSIDTSYHATAVQVVGKYAYVADLLHGLKIIDVSNSRAPTLTGSLDTNGAVDVYVSGKYAYVADREEGLKIIDVSNPTAPKLVGAFDTAYASGVYVVGKYAYVSDWSWGVDVIDVSNPANPTLVGATGAISITDFSDIYVSGRYAYVAGNNYVKIIDVINPTSPTVVAEYAGGSNSVNGVYVSGHYVYVANGGFGFRVLDVTNPLNPTLIGTYDTSGNASKVHIAGKYAYVADGSAGLQIFSLNGIETPTLYAGNIETNDITVNENIFAGGNIYGNGLNLGRGGLLSEGAGQFNLFATTSLASTVALGAGITDSNSSSLVDVFNITHMASSSATDGIGVGLTFSAEALDGYATTTARIGSLLTSVGGSATTSVLTFSTKNSSGPLNEWMRLDQNGFLGIGTTTPSKTLTVAGDIFTPYNISAASSTITYASSTGITSSNLAVTGTTRFTSLSDGCLSTVSGVVTSSGVACGSGSGSQDWRLTTGGGAITPTTTVGIAVFASSTIGDGTATGGLTIAGNSTTTGNAYFGGVLSLGSTTPSSLLTVAGTGSTDLFRFSSSTGTNLLALDRSGALLFGPSATSSIYLSGGNGSANPNPYLNSNNVAIGNNTLTYLSPDEGAQEGSYNIAIGADALRGSSTVPMLGNHNIALGYQALTGNTDGTDNIGMGYSALLNNTVGGGNIALGNSTLAANIEGSNNVGIGGSVLNANISGDNNVGVGGGTFASNLTGSSNVGVGYSAQYYNTSGTGNTSIGYSSAYTTNGDHTSAVGYQALFAALNGQNTALGGFAGFNQSFGTSSTFIGFRADVTGSGFGNGFSTSTAIGAGAKVGCSNCLVLGGTGANYTNVGIGTTTPSRLLTVQGGDAWFGGNITGTGTLSIAGGATTSSLYATTLGLNSEYFTDLTGSGLQNSSNALTCITSNSSTFGCLTAADWTIFNNKVSSTSIDTSAELASLITDETGSGSLVFNNAPTFTGTSGFNALTVTNTSTLAYASSTALTVSGNTYVNGTSTLATSSIAKLEVANGFISRGITWTDRAAGSGFWNASAYGNGRFVGVTGSGSSNRAMYSSDGVNWSVTGGGSASEDWYGVTYGNGLFVAVGNFAAINGAVMTSPDGINWSRRTLATSTGYTSVAYGNGTFVAVAGSFDAIPAVMTSPDGITWTDRVPVAGNWSSVVYGDNKLFVAVSSDGKVMTSPDGVTWTSQTAASASTWLSVTYGGGIYVAVGGSGAIMTSPDGSTWTSRTAPSASGWTSVAYGDGLFAAIASNAIMTSPDGIVWTARTMPVTRSWTGLSYGNGMFVGVSQTGSRALTTGRIDQIRLAHNNIYQGGMSVLGGAFNIGTTTASTSAFANNVLNIASTTGTSLFTILNSGYVGIGSTSPSRLLTVNGDINTPYNISAASSTITYASSTAITATRFYTTNFTTTYASTTGLTATYANFTNATTSNLKLTGVTASRALFTDADNLLTTSGVSQYLIDAITDETGTGSLVFSGNPLLAGFRSNASSTIGNGTGAGGLTIYGGATTTGNAYFAGSVGIGTNNPTATLEIAGIASSTFFYSGTGTAALPSLTFANDTNTGFYNPSADSVALVSGGTLGLRTTNNQAHLFTNQVFSSYAAQIGDYSNAATPINGGAGSTGQGSSIVNAIAQGGFNTPPSAFAAALYNANDGTDPTWWYGLINQRMGGSGWDNTPSALSQGSYIPGIGFAGQSGTTQGTHMELSAAIQGIIDGVVSPNVMPIGLIFRTSQTDSSGLREHMRITSTGTIGIGTTSPNAKLSIHAKNGETNPYLFVIASSTGSATTTLFSVSNAGLSSLTDLSVSGGATTSSLYATTLGLNSEYFTDLTGSGLQNSSNALTCITSNSSTFGCLTAGDWTIFNNKVSSTSIDTSAELASLITDETGSAGNLVFSGNPLLAGFRSNASSTIGNSTGAGGLTIAGNSTTTLNAYIGGSLAIGTTSPSASFALVGSGSTDLFRFASTTGSSLLTLDASGVLKFGTSTTADIFINGGSPTQNPQQNSNNVAIGNGTLWYASTTNPAQYNVAIGAQALLGSSSVPMSGDHNVAIGIQALSNNASGTSNVAIGSLSLMYNTTGYSNSAVGYGSLNNNATGYQNAAFGMAALQANTHGYQNAGFGYASLLNNTLGTNNTAMGWGSLVSNILGVENTSIGSQSLFQSTGSYNTAQGFKSLFGNSTGIANTATGWQALVGNTSGIGNTGVGYGVLTGTQDGSFNTALGIAAGVTNISGVANTYLGVSADGSSSGFSTSTAIGAKAIVGCSNCMVLGGTGANYVNVGIGTTTPTALLTIGSTTMTGARVAGIKQHFGFVNSTQDAVYYGNETYITNVPTATSTLVGGMLRIADTSVLGNVVRGFEAQAHRGTNTKGENTGLSGFGRTFGVRGTTIGDAGDTYLPAGVFAETQGTTQGNALRAYSGTITTEELVSLFHDTSNFTGTGLQMNFGNAGGSFAATSSAKFLDLQVAGTSKFTISANGSTTIGDGVTSASLRIPFGGICVDNDGSCISTTTGQIRSVTSALGNSDLAETYFSNQTLHAGEIVAISGGLSIKRAVEETEKDIIGVVSTKPGLTLGFDDTSLIPGENSYPIGLKGRVPIKLSTENGPIKKGDRIALSSIPGVGMKATESSRVVGIALEDYDGTRAYTAGFLNQFGDDMYKERIVAQKNLDPRAQDGCSYGGGNALGEEVCKREKVAKEKIVTPKADTTREDTLRAFAQESALETRSANGEIAYVGQAIMFIDLAWYQIDRESLVLSELASSTLLQNAHEGETVWSRIKTLAQNFVDGVLTVAGIKAERVEVTNELCVDGVCVTADDLRAILQNAHQGSQNTTPPQNNMGGGGGGVSVDSGTTDPSSGPEASTESEENTEAPPETVVETGEETISAQDTEETPEPSPEPEPPAPEPSPEPPVPEPTN